MEKFRNEPMVKKENQVHTTTDYSLFKSIDGNRNKNLLHINRLKKSMSENYLFTIITVNEKYEIIDGQHRFEIIKELNLPLNYVICEGYGLNEVHVLNANAKTWNSDDYLEAYCKLGYNDYILYRTFKQRYGFGTRENISILSGGNIYVKTDHMKEFFKGNFKVSNYSESCNIAENIEILSNYYDGYKRRAFVFAMISLFKNKNFNFNEFVQKLKLQQNALIDCVSSNQYISLIEEIYNFRRREKINLRY
jgi:hypothetical protein